MKILKYIANIFFVMIMICSCDQEETMMYEKDRAALNFSSSLTQYSFLKTGLESDTVSIQFSINGLSTDYIRKANFEIVIDSTTAVEGVDYSIVSTNLLPGELSGELKVKVNQPTDDMTVYFRVTDGEDFEVGIADRADHKLILTNKLTPPVRWGNDARGAWKSKHFLGTYSTAYYSFLILTTGETEFPYPWAVPGYNDGVKWAYSYKTQFINKVTDDLRKYNESIAPDVLLHDDGPAIGLPVIVGHYYTFD
ncbi:DUF4843 domain-containing protein [Ancylomarina sp. 16SWW S1-10-2]|uniref:DUF4843 domain-containing protein n=1 Tax=Ancylomarina sp. 16SWW S1-10-2 TaxID=2499681 RepID=UPI0018A03473|nr:DUF4843 domain-containing protein [Ancylomarina sp. 16SWW S1-10-2]